MKTLSEIINKELRILWEQRIMWTKEMVIDIAKNYSQMNHFKINEPKAYGAARTNGWLDDVREFMTPKYETWDEKKIYDEAKKYKTLKDFREQSPKAHAAAAHKGILDKLKEFLEPTPSSVPTLSPDDVTKESMKFKTKKDFRTNSPLAYRWALEYDLFGKTILHLGDRQQRLPSGFWTFDKVKQEASKYASRKEFSQNSPQAFAAAKQHGWYHEIVKDMPKLGSLKERGVYAWEFPDESVYVGLTFDFRRRELEHLDTDGVTAVSKKIREINKLPIFVKKSDYIDVIDAQKLEECTIEDYRTKGWQILNKNKPGGLGTCKRIWTYENVEKEAKKYSTKSDFKKFSTSAYTIAVREKWLDDVTQHMTSKYITWTPDMVYKISSKYNNLTDFIKQEPKVVGAARRLGIYYDVIKNMERSKSDTSRYRN